MTESDIGVSRAAGCAPKLQELNDLVKVSCHHGPLNEELVSSADVLVMTRGSREELIRWNSFCREFKKISMDSRGCKIVQPCPIRFVSVVALGAFGYIFSDFGDEFSVHDQTGEPAVQRVITHISNEKEGIVSLLSPNDSELARRADICDNDHEGYVSFSEVKGMNAVSNTELGPSLNDSGVWRAHEVWKRVPALLKVPESRGGDGVMMSHQYYVHELDERTGKLKDDPDRPDGLYWKALFEHECADVDDELFVRDENGNRVLRMNDSKEHYKIKIGDTRGFSPYEGGGILQQTLQPVHHHHKSFAESLQQPISENSSMLLSCDGEKEELGWWYPMLHVLKQGLYQFYSIEKRLPRPNDDADIEVVITLCKKYNSAMRVLKEFGGNEIALSTVDLDAVPRAPPCVDNLDENRRQSVRSLMEMGVPERKALLALEETDWSVDMSMSLCFDEEAMATLQSGVAAHECLEAMRKLTRYCAIELQPVCVFMGGVCAQEVVKHCGKYTPIDQWLHIDFIEVLPSVPPSDAEPQNCRYDHNIALFGKHIQDSLLNLRTFIVGCGALGCEILKNFALLGIGCGEKGLITVTDGDRIEVSNLNRQFLFRKKHVKRPKSVTAAESVRSMNPDININALELLASKDTENIFDENFWELSGVPNTHQIPRKHGKGLSFVVNALDNVKARKYVDSQCVFYKKALFESGTEGTKFNTQVIIPYKTVSYDEGETEASEGEAIPMCTLRNFPSTIVHCIEWARGLFEDVFVTPVADLNRYLEDPRGFVTKLRDSIESNMMDANELQQVLDKLDDGEGNGLLHSVRTARNVRDGGYSACVQLAFDLFTKRYNHAIRDLQHQFPREHMVNGKLFWSPPKRFPSVVQLDLSDENVISFLISAANLFAVSYGLHQLPVNGIDAQGNDYDTFVPIDSDWRDVENLRHSIPSAVKEWKPSSHKIEAEENGQVQKEELRGPSSGSMQDMISSLKKCLDELASISAQDLKAQPSEFEKDMDLNFHIDFVNAASNLRATNYGIPQASRHKTKMIAGKIIAAIATSTACATGLVGIEILKYIQEKQLQQYRDSSCNFAVNQFQMSEPSEAISYKGRGQKREQPDPSSKPELFDEKGNVRWDDVPSTSWKAYPDPHTKWDSLNIPGSMTLPEAIAHLRAKHNLALCSWLITLEDGKGKTSGVQIYKEPVVDVSINESVLTEVAPLSLSLQKATAAIMRCKDIKNKQGYVQQWGKLKKECQEGSSSKHGSSCMKDIYLKYTRGKPPQSKVKLDFHLEIASERGVEAITPPIYLDL